MERKTLASLEELQEEAARFVRTLAPKSEATLVTLSGELGTGKTSYAQGIARALEVTDAVTSPTFVIEKIYELEGKEFARLVHVDAYRLKSGDELAPLGFTEVLRDPQNLIVLEWPERVADALPTPACAITLEVLPDTTRAITYA